MHESPSGLWSLRLGGGPLLTLVFTHCWFKFRKQKTGCRVRRRYDVRPVHLIKCLQRCINVHQRRSAEVFAAAAAADVCALLPGHARDRTFTEVMIYSSLKL